MSIRWIIDGQSISSIAARTEFQPKMGLYTAFRLEGRSL